MPYVTKTKSVTKTRTLGYDPIPIHRPKFIYFEFTGLRPEAPHWMFFGDIEITKFVNTSYTKANYNAAERTSTLKNPGERFVNATEFPSGGGLTYGGATAQGGESDPLYSDANGILKGVFYLQSNTTYNWSINTDGHQLLTTDVYSTDTTNALSVGTALFKGFGQYENYWQWSETESYQAWVDPPRVYNDGGNDNNHRTPMLSVRVGNTWHNAYTTNDLAKVAALASDGGSITANNTGYSGADIAVMGVLGPGWR